MPKIKTNRAAAKRFKRTASGRFRYRQGYRNHILTKKPSKRKRHLRANLVIDPVDTPAVRRMLHV